MSTRAARTVLLLVATALLVTSCGDEATSAGPTAEDTSSPGEYAQGMCGAASAWMTALQDRNTQLQADLDGTSEDDVQAVKDLMVAFLDGAMQDTEELIDRVSALSPPDVNEGGQIHQGLLSAFTQARDLFAGARDQVAELDPSDRTAFTQALSALATTLGGAGTEIADSVQGLENADLGAAFAETPACAALSES